MNNNIKRKDWVGGSAAVFKTLGASNHTEADRQREITMPLNRRLRNGCASWSSLKARYWNLRVARVT
jgi:hypothetical protein|nr:MAG TPA: hypothetical protein [Caudoviricetes sp.]